MTAFIRLLINYPSLTQALIISHFNHWFDLMNGSMSGCNLVDLIVDCYPTRNSVNVSHGSIPRDKKKKKSVALVPVMSRCDV